MNIIDIIILSTVGGFALFGLWFGFVHTVGSLLGTVLGVYLASRYYEVGADWLIHITGWGENVSKVVVFIIAFIIINRLVGVVFWFLQRFGKMFTSLPFIKSLDRLLGLVFGAIEGMITIGVIVYFINFFPFNDHILSQIDESTLAPYADDIASVMIPLLPEGLRLLETTVDYVEEVVT